MTTGNARPLGQAGVRRRGLLVLVPFLILFFAVLHPAKAQNLADFEPDLLRLSEILGAVSYLDTLCGTPEADQWRVKMEALMKAQQLTAESRRRYVDSYNRGHRTLSSIHRNCTQQARFLIERYLEEGAAITDRLGRRYGGRSLPLDQGPVMDLGNKATR